MAHSKHRRRLPLQPPQRGARGLIVAKSAAPHQGLAIRWRFLSISVLLAAVVAGSLWGLHRWQLQRLATVLFDRANQLRDAGDCQQAAHTYHRFLQINPEHAEAHRELALCFDATVVSPTQHARAIDLYYRALGFNQDDLQLRTKLAERLLAQQRLTLAAEQAALVLAERPEDGDALRIQAFAQHALRVAARQPLNATAREQLQKAAYANSQHAGMAMMAATALRDAGRTSAEFAAADRLLDNLVQAAPYDAKAWLARYRYRRHFRLPDTNDDLARARELAPNDRDTIAAAAEDAFEKKDYQSALTLANQLIEVTPHSPFGYRLVGDICLAQGKGDEAIAAWQRGLQKQEASPELHLRLATALLARKQVTAAEPHLLALEETSRTLALRSRAGLAQTHTAIRMLRVQSHLLRHDWQRAVPLLREVALASPSKSPEALPWQVEAWLRLAEYEQSQQRFDLATESLERAVKLQPTRVDLRLTCAQGCVRAGQWQAALRHVRLAQEFAPDSVPVQLMLAQLQLAIQSRLPLANRNWTECDEALAAVSAKAGDDPRVILLQVARQLLQGDSRQHVQERLAGALDSFATQPTLLLQVASLHEHLGDSAAADRALALLEKVPAAAQQAALHKAEILIHRRDLATARELLLSHEANWTAPERQRAAQLWLRLESRAGQADQALSHWQRLLEQAPTDLPLRLLVAGDALSRGELKVAESHEQTLRQQEGNEGSAWRYIRARRLLADREDAQQRRPEVHHLAEWLTARRPNWPSTWLLIGLIAEQERDWNQAITAYQQVVTLDGTQLPVLERLVKLLYAQGRYSEVDRFLATLSRSGPLSTEASLIAIGSAAAQQDLTHALELARKAVEQNPDEVAAVLWLAHLQQTQGERAAAEQALTALVAKQPAEPRAWAGLLAYYQAGSNREAFRTTLQKLAAANVPPAEKAVLLAQGYELLEQPQLAAEQYKVAIRATDDSLALEMRLATVQLQYAPEAAESTLRSLRRKMPQSSAARRMLAITLAANRRATAWTEIETLLAPHKNADVEDLRLAAFLRLQRQGADGISDARRLFERVVERSEQPEVQDLLLLARLCEQDEDVAAARRCYERLMQRTELATPQLIAIADFFLRQQDGASALPCVERLRRQASEDWTTARLHALALQQSGREDELQQLLAELALRPEQQADQQQRTAATVQLAYVHTALERFDVAEELLRAAASADVQANDPLAAWLLHRERPDDALEVCFELLSSQPSQFASTLLARTLALAADASPAGKDQAEALVAELLRVAQPAEVLFAVGDLRLAQHRRQEAMELFERIVRESPENFIALNNVAALLADRPGQQSLALEYIDRAIAAAPQPAYYLHDTKAKILLHQDRASEALAELEPTVRRWPNSDPRVYVHLAMAYDRLDRHQDAQQAMREAQARGLQPADLTPGDRKLYDELTLRLAATTMNESDFGTP